MMVYKKTYSEACETCYGSVMNVLSVTVTERYQYAKQEKF